MRMTEKGKKICAIAGIIIFILFTAAVCWFVGRPLVRCASAPEKFREWISGYGPWSRVVYVGMVILQVFVALIPGEPLEIGAGYAFGAIEGTLLCLGGTVLGSILVFGFVRKFGVKAVEVFFSREKINSLKFMRDAHRLNLLTFILLLIPGTPKDIVTYCVGLTPMRFRTFLLITTVARVPSIITSTIGGNALGLGNHLFAAITFGVTLAISVTGILIYKRLTKGLSR